MNFSAAEKNKFLSVITKMAVEAKGRGPRDLRILYNVDSIEVAISGIITKFENYVISTYQEEGIDTLERWYTGVAPLVVQQLNKLLAHEYEFELTKYEINLREDKHSFFLKLANK